MAAESEKLPLGLQIPPVAAGTEIPPEPPDVAARGLSVAGRLLCGATTFFFMSFLFAYFYLRSLNNENLWKPAHVKPVQGLGAAFVACIILSAVLAIVAGRRMKVKSPAWLGVAAASVALGLSAVVIQCIEYTSQKFGPTNGAYASVFCAWTGFYLIAILGAMFWIETHVATELRARREPAAKGEGDIRDPDRLIAPGLDASVFFWAFTAALGVIAYVILYLI